MGDYDWISLKQLKERYDEFTAVICVIITKAYQIAFQLDKDQIYDYWIYPMIGKNVEKSPQVS